MKAVTACRAGPSSSTACRTAALAVDHEYPAQLLPLYPQRSVPQVWVHPGWSCTPLHPQQYEHGPRQPAQRHSYPNEGRKADSKLHMLNFLKLTINGKNSKSCFLWRFSSKITPRTAASTFIRMRKHSFILTSSLSVFIIGIKYLLSGHNASSCRVSHKVNLYNGTNMLCLGENWQSLNVTLKVHSNKQASLLSKQAESALVEVAEETVGVTSETLM